MDGEFSIGQMSKLHNVPIKTLRYYDEINLFKPARINLNNGYRYYSIEQFEKLNTIVYLRSLGMPLKDIREYLEKRNIDYFIELLKQEQKKTEKKIDELTKIKNRFVNRIDEIQRAKNIKELSTVKIVYMPDRKVIRLQENIVNQSQLEISLRELENLAKLKSSIIIGKVGLTIKEENIKKEIYDEYNSIIIFLEEIENSPLVHKICGGEYALIYYNGCDHKQSHKYYGVMKSYLEKENYKIIGDAIERVIINGYISNDEKDYITELQIPVKKY